MERSGATQKVKLIVEYDGTDFCGYQAQGKGERTVQSVMEAAVSTIYSRPIVFHTAGRTDTGVHAIGQVVSFDTDGRVPIDRLATAINSLLPADISVKSAAEADQAFHARFSAVSRTYAYLVWTRPTRSALWGRYSLHVRRPLNVEAMREAAKCLVGIRDFASFARKGSAPVLTTVRDLKCLAIRRVSDDRLVFIVSANGFLRSMVRNMVGVLLSVGDGEMQISDVEEILAVKDRRKNPCPPASPHGLCLVRVDY